jgi:hypothetical protein
MREAHAQLLPALVKAGQPELNLSELAKAIHEAHAAAEDGITAEQAAAQYTIQAALTCGAFLRQAKAKKDKLPHGHFLRWVKQEAKVPVRTAQNYMRLHKWVIVHQGAILKSRPHSLRQMYILAGILPEDEAKSKLGEKADELAKLKRFVRRLCLEAAVHRDYAARSDLLRALTPVQNLLDELEQE